MMRQPQQQYVIKSNGSLVMIDNYYDGVIQTNGDGRTEIENWLQCNFAEIFKENPVFKFVDGLVNPSQIRPAKKTPENFFDMGGMTIDGEAIESMR